MICLSKNEPWEYGIYDENHINIPRDFCLDLDLLISSGANKDISDVKTETVLTFWFVLHLRRDHKNARGVFKGRWLVNNRSTHSLHHKCEQNSLIRIKALDYMNRH